MKRSYKALTLILAAVLFAAFTIGAGAADAAEETLIGMILSTDRTEFFRKVQDGAEEKSAELGYSLTVFGSDDDASKDMTNMEDLISLNPAVILYNPVDSDAAGAVIGLANARNIPVITVDRSASGGNVVSHIASDNIYGGKIAGEYIIRLLDADGGQVVEIQGMAGTSAANDRGEGFHSAVGGAANIEVVVSQIGNWDKNQAMSVMENSLEAFPNIKAVFAHNDTMALGAMEACQNAQRGDIIIVGFDADSDAVAAVKNGTMTATVEQLPALMGSTGVEVAHKLLTGQAVEEFIGVEVNLITE